MFLNTFEVLWKTSTVHYVIIVWPCVFLSEGMPAETTMAICSMIFGGVFERFPKLKVCFAHGGKSIHIFLDNQLIIFWRTKLLSSYKDRFICLEGCDITIWVPGGAFPYTIGRIEHGFKVRPDLCATDNKINPRKYLGSFYTDSLVHDPLSLKLLMEVIGKVVILLSTAMLNLPVTEEAQ